MTALVGFAVWLKLQCVPKKMLLSKIQLLEVFKVYFRQTLLLVALTQNYRILGYVHVYVHVYVLQDTIWPTALQAYNKNFWVPKNDISDKKKSETNFGISDQN